MVLIPSRSRYGDFLYLDIVHVFDFFIFNFNPIEAVNIEKPFINICFEIDDRILNTLFSQLTIDGELFSQLTIDGELFSLLSIDGELFPQLTIDGELFPLLTIDGELFSQLTIDGELFSQLSIDGELFPVNRGWENSSPSIVSRGNSSPPQS